MILSLIRVSSWVCHIGGPWPVSQPTKPAWRMRPDGSRLAGRGVRGSRAHLTSVAYRMLGSRWRVGRISDWIERDRQLSSLISVRAELGRGDLRALYLGWLLCAQSGDPDDDDLEPPVPAALAQLSASLESLAAFLRVDPDLICVAAKASSPLAHAEPKPEDVRAWVPELPALEKDDLLARMIAGDGALAGELVQRVRREHDGDRARMHQDPTRRNLGRVSGRNAALRERLPRPRADHRTSARSCRPARTEDPCKTRTLLSAERRAQLHAALLKARGSAP